MEQGSPVRLVTAYRRSPVFDDEYIGRLSLSFHEHHPQREGHEFRVVADERWPTWWCKMAVFEFIALSEQPWYYADLDTIIVGRLPEATRFTRNHDFYAKQLVPQSGFMYVTPEVAAAIWKRWAGRTRFWMEMHRDADAIAMMTDGMDAAYWCDETPGQVVSYKVHCQHETPDDARVVCYHGNPRPHETRWATGGAHKHRPLDPNREYLPA